MEFKKIKAVLVCHDTQNQMALRSGYKIVAAVAPSPGDKEWSALDTRGSFVRVSGARIMGQGVEKTLLAQGYVQAEPGDPVAERLLDELAARVAARAIEKASDETALRIQREFGGQRVRVVPFDGSKPEEKAVIRGATSSMTMLCMGAALSSGMARVEYRPNEPGLRRTDIEVNTNWIVPEGTDPALTPRVSEYGGCVEEAVFLLQAVGLGKIRGNMHLVAPQSPDEDDPMPRGRMVLDLPDGDELHVGIDAADELVVDLVFQTVSVARRKGVIHICGSHPLSAGNVASSIVALLVRDFWASAARTARKAKKAA